MKVIISSTHKLQYSYFVPGTLMTPTDLPGPSSRLGDPRAITPAFPSAAPGGPQRGLVGSVLGVGRGSEAV